MLVQGGADTKYSGTGWGVMFSTVGDVYRDPCDLAKGVIPAAQVATPQKLAAVMATWPRFAATAAEPITVGGDTGLKLKLTSTGPASGTLRALDRWPPAPETGSADAWRDTFPIRRARPPGVPGASVALSSSRHLP